MLGARTKQVVSYGRRNQRIVAVSDESDRRHRKPTVNIFDDLPPPQWAPVVSKMKKRENAPAAKTPSPKLVVMRRKKKLSPVLSPPNVKKRARVAQLIHEEQVFKPPIPAMGVIMDSKSTKVDKATRVPLSPYPINILNSPALNTKPKAKSALGKSSALKNPTAPFVDINISVLDDEGRTISKERRVSKTIQPHSGAVKSSRVPSMVIDLVSSDGESESPAIRPLKPRCRRAKVVRVTSDNDASTADEAEEPLPPSKGPPASNKAGSNRPATSASQESSSHNNPFVPAPRLSSHRTEVSALPRSSNDLHAAPSSPQSRSIPSFIPSPIVKPRPLTPIRSRRGLRIYEPPSPPSPSGLSDFDLEAEFASLDIGQSTDPSISVEPQRPDHPAYLLPLLTECRQEESGPYEFSAFIDAFPLDPVVRTTTDEVQFRKIGEASYSEVFGIGDVVLKIIPLRDEQTASGDKSHEIDGPPPSDAKDVLKEIIVTQAMGQVSDGFVKLLKTYIVRGRYPEVLLDLWDEYLERNGSESVRPDTFLVSQIYAIIVLPNGGPDLEAYTFSMPTKTGWRQALSIFWQTAKTLAHAEQLVSFEHRDLHWGQILVKNVSTPPYASPLIARNLNQKPKAKLIGRITMDDKRHGVKVTLIDLGLSRMDAGDGRGGEMVHWTPFEEEVFMGEGDYQFDIYRLMREHNGNSWEEFRPLSNVMWLHYLAIKLLRSKKLKAPAVRKDAASNKRLSTAQSMKSMGASLFTPVTQLPSEYSERECYETLVEMEKYLSKSVAPVVAALKSKGKARRKTQAAATPQEVSGPSCAGELIEYGVKQGWVNPIR